MNESTRAQIVGLSVPSWSVGSVVWLTSSDDGPINPSTRVMNNICININYKNI
jgi:hypothetical protein